MVHCLFAFGYFYDAQIISPPGSHGLWVGNDGSPVSGLQICGTKFESGTKSISSSIDSIEPAVVTRVGRYYSLHGVSL